MEATNKMAIMATLHCLAGCSIGEILGMSIGAIFNWNNLLTTIVAFVLSFVSGYALSTRPIVKSGESFKRALKLVLAADTLSILTMELVDNGVMLIIPGALNAQLNDAHYWLSLTVSLTLAFIVAVPVNRYQLQKGKGHALTHHYMH